MQNSTKCPGCNGKLVAGKDNALIRTCKSCGGLIGSCYRGELYGHVKVHLPMIATSDDMQYFDFDVLGSDGVQRVHGWMDRATKRVVQYG